MSEIIMKKKKAKAFTLIELIIVLAIMAIIAAIAIPNFIAVRDNSKTKADVQSCAVIQRTVLMLVSDGSITGGAKTFDVTVGASVVTNPVDTTLQTALKDIKAPQGEITTTVGSVTTTAVATKYHISINDAGDVTVVTQ
ncbi:MAG TPA: prepilin-type N-terminal cleavage/methylation domain-containing protein [Clostridiaceae bacterium]